MAAHAIVGAALGPYAGGQTTPAPALDRSHARVAGPWSAAAPGHAGKLWLAGQYQLARQPGFL
jgi:hypothetical protein